MIENINFSVEEVRRFRDGVQNASSEMESITAKTKAHAGNAIFNANKIIEHIEGVLKTMRDDCQTAREVRTHNKSALERMKRRLTELNQQVAQLSHAYSAACEQQRAAAGEASRISSSSPKSTGDSKADAQLAKIREKQLAAARNAARDASKQASDIQAALRKTKDDIRALQQLIDQTVHTIHELDAFIKEIDDEMNRVDEYHRDIVKDRNQLESALSSYSHACYPLNMCLKNCCQYANRAMEYGKGIAKSLFPGGAGLFDSSYMMFTDHTAFGQISTDLRDLSERCVSADADIRQSAHIHYETLQDNVILQATKEVESFCSASRKEVEELKAMAKACANADKNLRAYYNLLQEPI